MTGEESGDDSSWCALLTPPGPGAIAVVALAGDVAGTLATLTGRSDWPAGRLHLARFADVDEGLAVRTAADRAELMPHGGPRVVERLVRRLAELGHPVRDPRAIDAVTLHPEARDPVEARMLRTLARARSPLAVDLLLDQPRRLRSAATWTEADEIRSRRLDRLVEPPIVVLAGPPNVGKSTLSNALLGRSMSIALDHPGTTRDYTTGLVDLGGLVVRWHDTPGLGAAGDEIERRAVDLARDLMTSADLLVAVTDGRHAWPDLPRPPDLRVAARTDIAPRPDADVFVCVPLGSGLDRLTAAVRERLVPEADRRHPGPWRFAPGLPRAAAAGVGPDKVPPR